MGHGGVYEVDRHGRPEPSVGGGELKFSSIPWGQEPPPTLHFLSLWAWPRGDPRLETRFSSDVKN